MTGSPDPVRPARLATAPTFRFSFWYAAGILYIVATPLGNLGDFRPGRPRPGTVDTVAAEDTRHTLGLLSAIDAHPETGLLPRPLGHRAGSSR